MDPYFHIGVGKSHDGFKLLFIVITKELPKNYSLRIPFKGVGLINAALNLMSLSISIFLQVMI